MLLPQCALGLGAALSLAQLIPASGEDPSVFMSRLSESNTATAITIHPGESIQAIVDASPAGSVFVLARGVHRLQSVVPRNGDAFLGEPGAIMSGARVLDGFTPVAGAWTIGGQTQQGQVHGVCERNPDGSIYEGCAYPEDLFIDDAPLRQVTRLQDLRPGAWYFDYDADAIYIADDPAGHVVETSVVRHAFHGGSEGSTVPRDGILIFGLVIEKYACPAQHGAVHARRGSNGEHLREWIVIGNEIRLNHGLGVRVGPGMRVVDNHVHDNGQLGIGGTSDAVWVDGNEIDHNNYAGFSPAWEAGGAKFFRTANLTVTSNSVHHNHGPGLWTDTDNIDVIIELNDCLENDGPGIFHEVSAGAIIRNNRALQNARDDDTWLWGSQILIAGSRNVDVHDNLVVVASTGGDGIGLVQQDRGGGAYGPHLTLNNQVHHNEIIYLGAGGSSGAAADFEPDVVALANNRFDFNTYRSPSGQSDHWFWLRSMSWDEFRAAGQEANGSFSPNIAGVPTTGEEPNGLGRPHPNPLRARTIVPYHLPVAGPARLEVYDVTGRVVRVLIDGDRPAGAGSATWDGAGERGGALPAGVYFLRLSATGVDVREKILLVR